MFNRREALRLMRLGIARGVPPTGMLSLLNSSSLAPIPDIGEPTLACALTGDCAKFESDTIDDDSPLPAGSQQVQTWTMTNPGTNVWERCTARPIFASGGKAWEEVNGPFPIFTLRETKPGTRCTIELRFTVPQEKGTYLVLYQLERPDGLRFGEPFWLQFRSV